jgi:hypothetical protein
MEIVLNILDTKEKADKTVSPFQHLNDFYKDQGLQFDEYGNPSYILPEQEPKKNNHC